MTPLLLVASRPYNTTDHIFYSLRSLSSIVVSVMTFSCMLLYSEHISVIKRSRLCFTVPIVCSTRPMFVVVYSIRIGNFNPICTNLVNILCFALVLSFT